MEQKNLCANTNRNRQIRISYCLKNYYIKNANLVPEGKFIPKWQHEWELKKAKQERDRLLGEASQYNGAKDVQVIIDGHRYKVI